MLPLLYALFVHILFFEVHKLIKHHLFYFGMLIEVHSLFCFILINVAFSHVNQKGKDKICEGSLNLFQEYTLLVSFRL
jgi:hypothetical protein